MNKKLYKALATFYGYSEEQNTDAKRVNHRLMILPEGMLGADGMIISEIIDNEINQNKNREMITYRSISNTVWGADACVDVTATIMQYYSDLKKLGDNDVISIVCLGLDGVPTIDEIRKVTGDTPQPIWLTDIYCSGRHPDSTKSKKGKTNSTNDMVASDFDVSRGSIPTSTLYHFLKKHSKVEHVSEELCLRVKKVARTTFTTSNGHIYAPLREKDSDCIGIEEWEDGEIETKDLYNGAPLMETLEPVLVHRMLYNYMQRKDPSGAEYAKFVHTYVADSNGFDKMLYGTIEPMVLHETQLARDTYFEVTNRIEVLTKPFKACEVIGKPIIFSPPVIVEYKTDIDHPMPYEGVICEYLKRKGFLVIVDEDVHPIDFHMRRSIFDDDGEDFGTKHECAVLYPMYALGKDQLNIQKIDVIIARDSDPYSGKMIIRGQSNSPVENAFKVTLTGNYDNFKHIIDDKHAPAEYMLTEDDFIYDGPGEFDELLAESADEDDDVEDELD